MLLPIKPNTPNSAVFTALNDELDYFLAQCVNATKFNKTLFSPTLREAVWGNIPTRKKFGIVWKALKPLTSQARSQISQTFTQSQDISQYYSNITLALPQLPATVEPAFSALGKHLFNHTCKLVDIADACGETVQGHFNKFRGDLAAGNILNGNICCCCGTEALAQYRADVDDDDQWRGPYDHLLAKEKYVLYAVHPDNLLPICHTCNSKAKLAKDLVRDSLGNRRRCFHPQTESAHGDVALEINITGISPALIAHFDSGNPITKEKLNTWNEVYRISERVEGEFCNLIEKLDQDCGVVDYAGFRAQLGPKAQSFGSHSRLTGWNFWKSKLYHWLDQQNDAVIQAVWSAIEAKRDDPASAEVYGI